MPRVLFLALLLSLLPASSMAAFQNPRISPANPRIGDQVNIVVDVTRPDLLGVAFPPNVISESSVTRAIMGNQIEITVAGTGGGFSNPSDQGEVVIPIGRFSEPGLYEVELVIVASTFGGFGIDLIDTLGFEIFAIVPADNTFALIALAAALVVMGGVSIRSKPR